MTSPVRLGVSPAAAPTPTGVFTQWSEALFPPALEPWVTRSASFPAVCPVYLCVNVGLQGLLVVRLPALFIPHSAILSPLSPSCQSLPLLPVWVNVSCLSPWLSNFHTVQFSVSSDYFLFLNCCCLSFGCVRRHSVSTYASILARS